MNWLHAYDFLVYLNLKVDVDTNTLTRRQKGFISNDDFLYTLGLFALEPIRWVERYEWRSLSLMEKCAK